METEVCRSVLSIAERPFEVFYDSLWHPTAQGFDRMNWIGHGLPGVCLSVFPVRQKPSAILRVTVKDRAGSRPSQQNVEQAVV